MNSVVEILNLLRSAGKTVATAESITAGHLQMELASISGASDVFKGGVTAYQLPVKVKLLGVDETLAEQTDCIDIEIARQMARGALKLFDSDYAIATCGYAENEENKPYAFFSIANAAGTISHSERVELSGDRVAAQKQTAKVALDKFKELLRSN
ncbi:CinA family protein [Pontiellaceae bacterium B1224]|nr:CinA family protein [Pontiellaceae bacterium B1224]